MHTRLNRKRVRIRHNNSWSCVHSRHLRSSRAGRVLHRARYAARHYAKAHKLGLVNY